MKCYIVKDLLPNYIDGLTGREATEDVKKHLETCEDCRAVYEQMTAAIPLEMPPEQKNVDFLKKLRTATRRQYAKSALLACILLSLFLAGFTIFAINYDIPVPYDPDHMSAEIYQAAPITNEYGYFQWLDLDLLSFEDKKAVLAGTYETIDMIRLACHGLDRTDQDSNGRTIYRNGEKIRVIYFCSTKSLWDILFFKDNGHPGNGWITTGMIYDGTASFRENYEPEMKEIYYLPIRNMDRLNKLSDEEFDAQRKKATLIWSGII